MTPARPVPRVVAAALRPPDPHCYGHCSEPVRPHPVTMRLPGSLAVYACPGGVVSVSVYAEWAARDPSTLVLRELRRRASPARTVLRRDLRLATRHGPELGPDPERFLAERGGEIPVRVVYWRRYPVRRGAVVHRLFACFRHGRGTVRFYVAPDSDPPARCPACRRSSRSRVTSTGRSARARS